MRDERRPGWADHNPEGAKAIANGEVPPDGDASDDSANRQRQGARRRSRSEAQENVDHVVEPENADASDRGGSASWGSEGSGGSVIDKRGDKR